MPTLRAHTRGGETKAFTTPPPSSPDGPRWRLLPHPAPAKLGPAISSARSLHHVRAHHRRRPLGRRSTHPPDPRGRPAEEAVRLGPRPGPRTARPPPEGC